MDSSFVQSNIFFRIKNLHEQLSILSSITNPNDPFISDFFVEWKKISLLAAKSRLSVNDLQKIIDKDLNAITEITKEDLKPVKITKEQILAKKVFFRQEEFKYEMKFSIIPSAYHYFITKSDIANFLNDFQDKSNYSLISTFISPAFYMFALRLRKSFLPAKMSEKQFVEIWCENLRFFPRFIKECLLKYSEDKRESVFVDAINAIGKNPWAFGLSDQLISFQFPAKDFYETLMNYKGELEDYAMDIVIDQVYLLNNEEKKKACEETDPFRDFLEETKIEIPNSIKIPSSCSLKVPNVDVEKLEGIVGMAMRLLEFSSFPLYYALTGKANFPEEDTVEMEMNDAMALMKWNGGQKNGFGAIAFARKRAELQGVLEMRTSPLIKMHLIGRIKHVMMKEFWYFDNKESFFLDFYDSCVPLIPNTLFKGVQVEKEETKET